MGKRERGGGDDKFRLPIGEDPPDHVSSDAAQTIVMRGGSIRPDGQIHERVVQGATDPAETLEYSGSTEIGDKPYAVTRVDETMETVRFDPEQAARIHEDMARIIRDKAARQSKERADKELALAQAHRAVEEVATTGSDTELDGTASDTLRLPRESREESDTLRLPRESREEMEYKAIQETQKPWQRVKRWLKKLFS